MLLEVLNVLGVRQVLELGVLAVVLLPVVDLVLVLVVAVVAGAGTHVGQRLAVVHELRPLGLADVAVAVGVEEVEQGLEYLIAPALRDGLVGLVVEAVGAEELVALPLAVAVVVVEGEEGAGVPAVQVVLLYFATPLDTEYMLGADTCCW